MATTIKIGHSSISELNTANGVPGDSTGTEVYTVDNYDIPTRGKPDDPSREPFTHLLRPVNSSIAEKSAKACEAGCNNSHIGYGQNDRDTLRKKALKLNSDLTQVNLADITEDCNCDCSSFMSLCAEIAGAKIDQSSGIPTTHVMVTKFSKYGDYKVFEDAKYFTQSDYLKRGDILVKSACHTIMILENGSKAGSGDFVFGTNENIPEQVKFIELTITKMSADSVTADCAVIVKQSKSGEIISNGTITDEHKWSCKVVPISDTKLKTIEKSITVKKRKFNFSVTDLVPNTSYYIEVVAKNKKSKEINFSSHNIIFTTPEAKPAAVRDLNITSSSTNTLEPSFNISFKEPSDWNKPASYTSGYRISLFVNGCLKATSDTLIKPKSLVIETVISLKDLISTKGISYGDVVQVGIQAWNKDSKNNLFFDHDQPKCSKPFYITPARFAINSANLRVTNSYKRVIVHDKLKGV